MGFDAGSITSTLGIDVGGFTQGMLQAQGIAQLFPSVVTNFLANPLLGVIDIAKRAGEAVGEAFKSATDRLDDLGDSAKVLGVPVQFLNELDHVMRMAGGSAGSAGEALKFLGRSAAEAAGGNKELLAAYTQLGIGGGDLRELLGNLPALTGRVADGLAGLGSAGEKTAVAMQVAGRGGSEVIRALGDGSEAMRKAMADATLFPGVVSDASAASAGAFNDLLDTLRFGWEDLKELLAEPIRDALMPTLQDLVAWARSHVPEIKETVGEMAKSIVQGLTSVAEILKFLSPLLETVARNIGPIVLGAAAFASAKGVLFLAASFRELAAAAAAAATAQAAAGGGGGAANAAKGLGFLGVGGVVLTAATAAGLFDEWAAKKSGLGENAQAGAKWGGGIGTAVGGFGGFALGGPVGAAIGAGGGNLLFGGLGAVIGKAFDAEEIKASVHDAVKSSMPDWSTSGGDFGRPAGAQWQGFNDAKNSLDFLQKSALDVVPDLRGMGDVTRQVGDAVRELTGDLASAAAGIKNLSGAAEGVGRGGGQAAAVTYYVTLQTPPLDVNDASSVIAGKLVAPLQRMAARQSAQLASAASRAVNGQNL